MKPRGRCHAVIFCFIFQQLGFVIAKQRLQNGKISLKTYAYKAYFEPIAVLAINKAYFIETNQLTENPYFS